MVRSKINKKKEQLKEAVLRPHNSSEEISDIYIRKPSYYDRFVKYFPNLETNLIIAGVAIQPSKYIEKSIITSIINSVFGLIIAFFLIRAKEGSLLVLFPLFFMFLFIFIYLNFFKLKIIIRKKKKAIDNEVVYAGRYVLVELSAGVPLFDALVNVSQAYPKIGGHIQEIIKKVEVGKPLDTAINEIIEVTPSANFRKMMWQIMNSLRTGADVSVALESIIEQISQEQIIEFKAYERKLNPLVMFYLMMAVIFPSLGITMMSLLSTFLGFQLGLGSLVGIAIFLTFIQFMFLNSIRNSRPGFAL